MQIYNEKAALAWRFSRRYRRLSGILRKYQSFDQECWLFCLLIMIVRTMVAEIAKNPLLKIAFRLKSKI
jgi:hypothetical protein